MIQAGNIRVLGAGITAHATALLLSQQGWRVQLSAPPQRHHDASVRDIRAYAINHRSRATLSACGVWPAHDQAPWITPVRQMRVFGDTTGQLFLDPPSINPPQLTEPHDPVAWMVEVPALEDALLEACQSSDGIATDGVDSTRSTITPDLTVVCEGQTSTHEGFERHKITYPHRAIAARVRASLPHEGVAQQWFDGERILALLPIGGATGSDLAVVWSVPTAEQQHWLANTSETGTVPLAAELTAQSRNTLGTLRMTAGPVGFPLSVGQVNRWFEGQTVLVGDAAHTIHPLAGQGLNLGLADVQTLADCLATRQRWEAASAPRLMRRYERQRRADTQALQWATHGLFHLFTNDLTRQTPMAWLRNTGLSAFNALPSLKRWAQQQAMGN
ncbi:MAG: FAD-dependent monooxygenase [Burkholderiaceae bacterium]